jgi:ELWxxDGT repeat protein
MNFKRLKNINETAAGAGSSPADFRVFNGALYFIANDGVSGTEPWKTDGTPGGTARIKDICPGVRAGISD